MATAQNLLDLLREICGDKSGNSLTDAFGVDILNVAQDDLAENMEVFTVKDGISVSANTPSADLPADCVRVMSLVNTQGIPLDPKDIWELEDNPQYYAPSNVGSVPLIFAVESKPVSNVDRLWLWPTPSTGDPTATLQTTMSSSVATIVLDSVSTFGPYGIVKIESEKILYLARDTTNNQLTKCVRGWAGTTAAAHTAPLTVTLYGLTCRYVKILTALSASSLNSIAEWPDKYRMKLVHYAAYLYYNSAEEEKEAIRYLNLSGIAESIMARKMRTRNKTGPYLRRRDSRLTRGRAGGSLYGGSYA